MRESKKDIENNWLKRGFNLLRKKVRIIIVNNETYEEKKAFNVSATIILVYFSFFFFLLLLFSFLIISTTSLKHMIPGFPNTVDQERAKQIDKKNLIKLLEYEKKIDQNNKYYQNLSIILGGGEIKEVIINEDSSLNKPIKNEIEFNPSIRDSLLRLKIDDREKYDISISTLTNKIDEKLNGVLFFSPLIGEITNRFNVMSGHYGLDIVASKNEAVKAILNGTVIFSDWSPDNGHVIQVQHVQNLISVYKHNSFLLKKIGDLIKAGDPIAIVGNSGSLSTGPHLHFELWHNGIPLDPEKFIVFD